MKRFRKIFISILAIATVLQGMVVYAVSTGPQYLLYEGDLQGPDRAALTGTYDFRFSFWKNEDLVDGVDVINGVLNTGATNYLGWNEEHTETLGSYGRFAMKLGELLAIPGAILSETELYLQVEVKSNGSPVTSYELLDADFVDAAVDRLIVAQGMFSREADLLDGKDSGFGAGEIPYLDDNGMLPESTIPGGTYEDVFVLDYNDSAAANEDIELRFGTTLAETILWSGTNGRFEISNDLYVDGDIILTGSVTLGSSPKVETLSPTYPGSVFIADGSNNSGLMYEDVENISSVEKNIIYWISSQADLNDYDMLVRFTLPAGFSSLSDPAISLLYQTENTIADAKIDLIIEKEDAIGTDQISGTGIGLNANTWTTTTFTMLAGTTWTAGDTINLKFKFYAKGGSKVKISDLKINYEG